MKIISYGHVKPKAMLCRCCGATYEYIPRDIENFRPGTRYAKNFVRCPVCGHATWINDMLIKHEQYTIFAEDK